MLESGAREKYFSTFLLPRILSLPSHQLFKMISIVTGASFLAARWCRGVECDLLEVKKLSTIFFLIGKVK
jgi:hypothetical protein